MAKVRVLPDAVANKIAAGEVVERPASVVKELLENALDAGSRKVHVEIEQGGKRLIRVLDDGEGLERDDAILAFERHATSKLRSAEDLEAITTLGFRGEALPSIASVSRLALRTRTAAAAEGTEVEFLGGKLVAVRDIAWPGGTEVEVKDLFFNVPARRKFLKSDATETFHITNLVQHYALANPEVGFLLVNNGREAVRCAPVASHRDRAYQVLGAGLLGKLVPVESRADGLRITGLVSNPQEQRSSRDAQYLFVNGRFVKDQLIGRALSEAYRAMMPSGTYPAAVLFIEVPPTEVDVNVHPAKTELRFLHESRMVAFVRDAVADALRATRPVTQAPVRRPAPGAEFRSEDSGYGAEGPRDAEREVWRAAPPAEDFRLQPPAPAPPARQAALDLSFAPPAGDAQTLNEGAAPPPDVLGEADEFFETEFLDSVPGAVTEEALAPAWPEASNAAAVEQPAALESQVLPELGHGIKPLGQIRDSYIVATDEEGLLLIDQHVAHERVLFEKFRASSLIGSGEVQPLLIPVTVDLSPAEAAAFEAVQPELEHMGIEASALSGRTIAIKTAPGGLNPDAVIAVVREALGAVERERRNLTVDTIRDQIAASMACKAAIKVNMPLTREKMSWLIDELMKADNSMTCPHGRPIIMRLGLRDIERGFNRPV